MTIVESCLAIVGDDSIKNLYEFVEKRQALANEKDDFVNWLMYTRILTEISLAITSYTGSEERRCPESKN